MATNISVTFPTIIIPHRSKSIYSSLCWVFSYVGLEDFLNFMIQEQNNSQFYTILGRIQIVFHHVLGRIAIFGMIAALLYLILLLFMNYYIRHTVENNRFPLWVWLDEFLSLLGRLIIIFILIYYVCPMLLLATFN